MSTETSVTPAGERRVIFVGDKDAALKATSRVMTAPIASYLVGGLFGGSIARFGVNYALANTPLESLMVTLASTLDLGCAIISYSQQEAQCFFSFGVGHLPRIGSLYVQHPVLPDVYIAPEDFSRILAQEKEAAFRQLASALGAKEIRLTTATVHTKKGLFGTTVSVPEAATEVGIKVSFDSSGSFVKQVYSRFGPPRRGPHVPDDLRQWVEMDPDLRTMARDRTEGHLLEHRITLEFKEGMGVGAEVAAKVAGRGLTAGGSYSAMSHSVWQFEAEYWPID